MKEAHPMKPAFSHNDVANERKWRQMMVQGIAILSAAIIIAILVNHLRFSPLPLIGDWSVQARLSTPSGRRLAIPLEEAKALFQSGTGVFLDARPAEDFQRGHIEGARSLPWTEAERLAMEVVGELADHTPIIAYCDGETCNLSKDLALFLDSLGYTRVYVLVNGWTLWMEKGLPVASGMENGR